MNPVKVVFISDTHNHKIDPKDMPEGDLLIHSGDCSGRGSVADISKFNAWLGSIKSKYKKIIFVPGNHDFLFQHQPTLAIEIMTNCEVLINKGCEFQGLKIWGSPITPTFGYWAFMRDRGSEIAEVWETIPKDTDILITHGPPFGILDGIPTIRGGYNFVEHVGCRALLEKVKEIKPKIHCFGHIHEAHGTTKKHGITFINASIMDGDYSPENSPFIMGVG